jgi:hypothetical protein
VIEAAEAGHGTRVLQAEHENDGRWRVGIATAADGTELANIWLTDGMLADWLAKVALARQMGPLEHERAAARQRWADVPPAERAAAARALTSEATAELEATRRALHERRPDDAPPV